MRPADGLIENLCGMIMVRKNLLVSCSIEHRHQPERLKFDEAEKEEKPKHTRSAEDERLNERESRGGRDHRRKHHSSSGDEKKQRSHSNSPE